MSLLLLLKPKAQPVSALPPSVTATVTALAPIAEVASLSPRARVTDTLTLTATLIRRTPS